MAVYNPQQLTAYRVKRKLLGQTGAPMVQRSEEFWRERARHYATEKERFAAFIFGWYGLAPMEFSGSARYPIHVDGKGRIRARKRSEFWNLKSRPVGRLFPNVILLSRRAPRWLRTWMATSPIPVYVLPGALTLKALRAHLVGQKLRGAT